MIKKLKTPALVLFFMLFLSFGTDRASAGPLINDHLPKWMELDIQLRHRFEYRSNFDFNDALDDEDGFNLWRSRLGLTLKPMDDLKLFYQFQDARISDDSFSGSKAAYENWGETRQLWMEFKTYKLAVEPINLSKVGIKFGRQELSYGAQRLLGAFDWSNVAQTFDAGKIILEFDKQKLNIDIFGGGKTPLKSPREMDDFYDGSADDRIGGYYAVYKGIKDITIDQYVINRNTDGQSISFGQTGDGEVDDFTIGGRVLGKVFDSNFDFELEAAKQVGNSGSLDVDAQMAVVILGYTLDHAWKPRASFEFDYASGDDDSTDGERQTFDNIQPTNHPFYGFMDFVSLQNINDYRFQIKADPTKKLNLQADYHLIYLDTPEDNLYAANRTIKRATAAGADSYVGSELDFLSKYQVTNYMGMMWGYSHLFSGNFLKDTGASDDADFAYVQTTFNF
ncbi:MAG: alginate export family protein [Candidatus Omnitrophica bacterium]|nr:alginate export family protein [Candidatus Omnitrophota bacterium]